MSETSLLPSDRGQEPPHAIKPRNLALGIERIGFYALSHRTLCVLAFVVLSLAAAVGFARVKVDDSLSERSDPIPKNSGHMKKSRGGFRRTNLTSSS